MHVVGLVLSWFFGILFGLLTLSMFLMGNRLRAILLLGATLLLIPPVRGLLETLAGATLSLPVVGLLVVGLLGAFVLLGSVNKPTSIYKSARVKAQFMEIYDAKMAKWPVTHESVYVDTSYGRVHVIVSGPDDAAPMLLLHASGVPAWSWRYNVEELSQRFRTYAIDLIGDAGRSEYDSLSNRMRDGQDEAELYAEIADQLGVGEAYVVGASEGGFVGTQFALHAPERVRKLVLLGPMGYSGATQSVARIMFAQFFPLKGIQESTFRWAFSDDPKLVEEFGEWFRLVMTGLKPVKVAPLPFKPEQRQRIQAPVLLVLGKRDNLVGDPAKATALVQDVPDIRVEVLDTGHLVAAEHPKEANALILDFCA
jgi:pimeloyl-ACP methyl ester carboxylesterase